jgi:hypothetical protein
MKFSRLEESRNRLQKQLEEKFDSLPSELSDALVDDIKEVDSKRLNTALKLASDALSLPEFLAKAMLENPRKKPATKELRVVLMNLLESRFGKLPDYLRTALEKGTKDEDSDILLELIGNASDPYTDTLSEFLNLALFASWPHMGPD